MRLIKRFTILLLLALIFSFTFPVSAETINVACNPTALRTAITQANLSPTDTTLTLSSGCTYTFTDTSSTGTGTALPNVGSNIVIVGNGATIQRSGGSNFRLFYVNGGHLHLQSLTVRGGAAPALGGGGIYVGPGATVTLDHSALIQNSAAGLNGGGMLVAGNANVFNATVSGNSAASGGGLYVSGSANIRHATIAANTASGNGGGILSTTALNIYQTIVGDNNASSTPDIAGSLAASAGFNIFETASFSVTGSNVQANPMIGALANNGGPTLTHLPAANSPALETGDPTFDPTAAGDSTTDQRGQPRMAGLKTDVGSVEIAASATVSVTVNSSTANGTYFPGQQIPITVGFSMAIQFQGTPLLTLETRPPGQQDTITEWPFESPSPSPTTTINLRYTITDRDMTADLDYVAGQPLVLAAATEDFPVHTRILSASGLPINLTIPAPGATGSLGANKNIVVNSAPRVLSIEVTNPANYVNDTTPTQQTTYGFRVTFSEPVTGVDGTSFSAFPDFNFQQPPQPPPLGTPQQGDIISSCGENFSAFSITSISPTTPRGGTPSAVYNVTVSVNPALIPRDHADCTLFLQVQDYPDDTGQRLIVDSSDTPYRGAGEQDNFPVFREAGNEAVLIDYVPPDSKMIGPTPSGGSNVGSTVPVFFEVLRTVDHADTVKALEANPTTECAVVAGNITGAPPVGTVFMSCTSPWIATMGVAGNNTVFIRSHDLHNNQETVWDNFNRRRFFRTADTTAPVTQINTPPSPAEGARTNANPVSFSFTATGFDGAAPTFQCQIDDNPYQACSSGTATGTINYPDLAEGPHTFRVFAIDGPGGFGREAPPQVRNFIVDRTPPVATVTNPPNDNVFVSTPSFSFSSNETGSTFQCSFQRDGDPDSFVVCASPYTPPGGPFADGFWVFKVRATDPAGNLATVVRTIIVDRTGPETTINSQPSNPTGDSTPDFTFSSSESDSTLQCRLYLSTATPPAFSACNSGTFTQSPPLTVSGTYIFDARAIDVAGNADATPATYTFVVDVTPPDTTITVQPSSPTTNRTPTWNFTSNEAGVTFQCSLTFQGNPDFFASCLGPVGTHTPPSQTAANATFVFKVRAIDAVGNVDPTPATQTYVVDNTAPDTTITFTPLHPSDPEPSWWFTSSEPAGATFACSLVLFGSPDAFGPCNGPGGHTGFPALSDGTYTFKVRATDAAGNVDPTPAAHTWGVDSTDPETIITIEPVSPGDPWPVWYFEADEPVIFFECSIVLQGDEDAFAECSDESSHTPRDPLAEGTYVFKVQATDKALNTDLTPATDVFVIDFSPPSLEYAEPEIDLKDGANAIPDGSGSITFAETTVGSPVSMTFTIENTGAANLIISNFSAPAGFSVAAVSGDTVEPGTTETFSVTCDATIAGVFSGSVSFENNDIHESPYDFTISCVVIEPTVETEPPAPTEEPVTETPTPTEEPVTETPVPTEEPPTETPVPTEEPPMETPAATEEPATETLVPTEEPTPELTVLDEETPVADDAQVSLEAGETLSLTIRNDGAGDLALERSELLEDAPVITVNGGFTLSDDVDAEDLTLIAGAEAEFAVSCPVEGGVSGALAIFSNDADEDPFELTLICAAVPTPEPEPTDDGKGDAEGTPESGAIEV